ncbi:hypothetical protein Vretifemale_1891 [Volvox reticuliferus]|nr:hypothetical protein Vretifemale_1891 [Volvox reticuliferus]
MSERVPHQQVQRRIGELRRGRHQRCRRHMCPQRAAHVLFIGTCPTTCHNPRVNAFGMLQYQIKPALVQAGPTATAASRHRGVTTAVHPTSAPSSAADARTALPSAAARRQAVAQTVVVTAVSCSASTNTTPRLPTCSSTDP